MIEVQAFEQPHTQGFRKQSRSKIAAVFGLMRDGIIDPITLQGQPVPARPWLVPGLIPLRNVTFLNGDGGVGKSLLSLQLLMAAATGGSWISEPVKRCRAFGVFAEDDKDEIHRRLVDVCNATGTGLGDLEDLKLASRVGLDNVLMTFGPGDTGDQSAFFSEVMNTSLNFGAELIVLDSLHDLFAGNENNRSQARQFVNSLRLLATECDAAVVVNCHPSAAGMSTGTGTSGSTAWNNAIRSRLYLTRPTGEEVDNDARVLKTMKANYGRAGGEIKLRWENGAFQRIEVPTGQFAVMRRDKVERLFLACLAAVMAQGRHVTDAPASPRYAPKVFAELPMAERTSKQEMRSAMASLFDQRRIKVDAIMGPDRHRQKCVVPIERGQDAREC